MILWLLLCFAIALTILFFSAVGRAQTTPNLHLNIPNFNTSNWNVPLNQNFNLLDAFLSGGSALPNLSLNNLLLNVSGTGCARALNLFNSDLSPTNPNKYFRVNQSTGALELVNSACTSVLFSVSDTGILTFPAQTLNATQYQVNGTAEIFTVASDFTLAANTNLQTITGLSWVLAANTVQSVPFSCHLLYSQAAAAVADQFGVQAASLAPTNFAAQATVQTNSTAFIAANLPTLTTTTATAVITFTPSAITTIWIAEINGLIQNPSGVANTINIMAQTSNSSDLLTVKQGSFCRVY